MSSKDAVLQFLEENSNNFVSGESMAESLSLSRNSIWKAVNELRERGYDIEAVRNKGYRLVSNNDIISLQGIVPFLNDDIFTPDIHIFKSLESTNTTAKEMAVTNLNHGTVVIAGSQTNGKGHFKSSFGSPEGGLYMSIILDPAKSAIKEASHISAWSTVSTLKAFKKLLGLDPEIRLITDIYYKDKKISGIMAESAFDFETEQLQWIVIGIGIPSLASGRRNEFAAEIINNLLSQQVDDKEIISCYQKHHK